MNRPDDTILMQYVAGQCAPEVQAGVAAWMAADAQNAREVFELERLSRRMEADRVAETDIDAAEQRVRAAIKAKETSSHSSHLFPIPYYIRRFGAVAACVAVLIGVAVAWQAGLFGARTRMLTARGTAGTPMEVRLGDGTRVWLHEGAALTYPERFDDDARRVELEGEAYFEVAKDKARPFTAASKVMDVRVLGTKFNFRATAASRSAVVSLVEGSVQASGHGAEGSAVLRPGQRAVIAGGALTVEQADTRLDAVWHDNLIPFTNANLKSIALGLEQVYGVAVIISADLDQERTYSGEIRRKTSLDSLLRLLCNTIPMTYRIEGQKVFLEGVK